MNWLRRFFLKLKARRIRSTGEVLPIKPPPQVAHHIPPPKKIIEAPASPKIYHDSPRSRPNLTTGERHLNPLNVKAPRQPYWKGQVDRDSRGHAVFDDLRFGIRAGIIILRSYWTVHDLQTIEQILARWAPVTDTIGSLAGAAQNDPGDYAIFVAKRVGISPRTKLDIFTTAGAIKNEAQLFILFNAMARYENHPGYIVEKPDFDGALKII